MNDIWSLLNVTMNGINVQFDASTRIVNPIDVQKDGKMV